MPRTFLPGAALAVARNGAVDDLWVVLLQRVVVDPEALRHARPETFDCNVAAGSELCDKIRRRRMLEVDRDASLVAVFGIELHRNIRASRIPAGRLHLEHVGA